MPEFDRWDVVLPSNVPLAIVESANCSIILSTLGVFGFFPLGHSGGCVVVAHGGSNSDD